MKKQPLQKKGQPERDRERQVGEDRVVRDIGPFGTKDNSIRRNKECSGMQRARRSSHSASRTGLPHLAPASKKSSRLAPSRASAARARAGRDLKATGALVGCGRLGRRDVHTPTVQLVQVIRRRSRMAALRFGNRREREVQKRADFSRSARASVIITGRRGC
jgi:hypothetical protein